MKYKILIFSILPLLVILFSYYNLPIGTSFKDSLKISKARILSERIPQSSALSYYQLEIGDKNMAILEECRAKAIKSGVLTDDNQPYVKGVLKINQSKYKVKVKLKGTLKSHWADPIKWSFRVVIKDGICKENGLKVFSLQSSNQRGDLVDIYYQHLLKSNGLISLNIKNINCSINGSILEQYTLEEFFDTPLLTSNNRAVGPILKFDYDEYWKNVNWKDPQLDLPSILNVYNSTYENAPIKEYNLKSTKKTIDNNSFDLAKTNIDLFRRYKIKSRELFDIDLFGKYLAINTILGNQHPTYLTNLRFYFNPTNKIIEPIGYDIERIHLLTQAKENTENFWPHKVSSPEFIKQLFSDSLMTKSYLKNLKSIAKLSILKELETIYENEKNHYKNSKVNNHLSTIRLNILEIQKMFNHENKD